MTAHEHPTLVDGCYRCELNKDEMACFDTEDEHCMCWVKGGPCCACDSTEDGAGPCPERGHFGSNIAEVSE